MIVDEHPPPPRKLRRALRLVAWNALLLIAGLALIGLVGETWRRSTVPFPSSREPTVFVPDVGLLLAPDTEIRWTNEFDFWTVFRTNHLGFADREPPSPERAAESCHVAVIGDSFVEAKEVPIPEKFHVLLEGMAARELPALDVTTSAFGRGGTGQINQLAFYDEYVRPLRPQLVVLVFVPNDYRDNYPLWMSMQLGLDPEHLPYVSAARAEDGSFRLRPPDPEYRRYVFESRTRRLWKALGKRGVRASWFLSWLHDKHTALRLYGRRTRRMELLNQRPAHFMDVWFEAEEDGPPLSAEEILAFTTFGLDEFKKRAERDGAALVILAAHRMSRRGGGRLARLNEMAAERRIPVVDQSDFIRRQGAKLRDAQWAHDSHWSPAGHRWAAEALLEWLKQNQDVCE